MPSTPSQLLREPITQRLILLGTITEASADQVARSPDVPGRRFAERAYLSGAVTDEQLVAAFLSLGARDATRIMSREVPAALKTMIPADIALLYRVVPMQSVGTRLHLAMLDPSDGEAVEKCAFQCGMYVEPWVARAAALFDVLCSSYGGVPPSPLMSVTARATQFPTAAPSRTPPRGGKKRS